jgi:hypothetical protein
VGKRILTFRGKVVSSSWTFWPLRLRYYVASKRWDPFVQWLRRISDERTPQLHRCENLKTRITLLVDILNVWRSYIRLSSYLRGLPHSFQKSARTIRYHRAGSYYHNSYQLRGNKSLWRSRESPRWWKTPPPPPFTEPKGSPSCSQEPLLVLNLSQLKPMHSLAS